MQEKPDRPVVLIATSIFDQFGGIQTYMRLLIRALAESNRLHAVHSFHGEQDDDIAREWSQKFEFDFRGAGACRGKFVANLLVEDLRESFGLLGHLSLGPVGWFLRDVTRQLTGYGTVLHGEEAWTRLPIVRRIGVGLSDVIISTTPFTRAEFGELNDLEDASHAILPLALEPDRFTEPTGGNCSDSSPSLEILTVGRLGKGEKYKGVDDMIRAISIAVDRGLDIEYTIIGDGNDRARLESLVTTNDVDAHVNFHGHVSDPELKRCFETADVFAMPSSGEGFGLVYLEAMHYGLPIIASPEGGAKFVIRDGQNGVAVEYGDAHRIADALEELAQPQARQRLARGARRDVEGRFAYSQFQENLEDILSEHADD